MAVHIRCNARNYLLFSETIKGSVTCNALEGQVRRIESYLDVEPLEGRYETTPRRNSRDVLRGAWI